MAKVTYTGPGPGEVYPYFYRVDSPKGKVLVEGHRFFNAGVSEDVPEPENIARFLKIDRSAVKLDATKTEIAAAEAWAAKQG